MSRLFQHSSGFLDPGDCLPNLYLCKSVTSIKAFMSDDGADEDIIEADSEHEEWIPSVDKLVKAGGPVESREFNPELDHLEDTDIEYLDEQTIRILNRHSEIERDQRRHASRIIRITLIIIGAIATAIPFIVSIIQSITFPQPVPPANAIISLILLLLTVALAEAIVFDIYSIVSSTFDVMTPEKTERGLVGRILTLLNVLGPEAEDEEAGGGVRSVSILDELAPVIDNPGESLRKEIVVNRLNRIRRNERVIDHNDDHLRYIYQRAELGLERTVSIFVLILITFTLLGGSI